jgi:THUMP domain-like
MTTAEFIAAHLTDDPHRLLLSAHRYPDLPMAYIAAQVQALQKIRDKVPSWYNPQLRFPAALSLEQASSEQAAQFKAGLFRGQRMADLTGGLGIDSWAWAQCFAEVTYVEQQAELVETAAHNFAVLGMANIRCRHTTAETFLAETDEAFDLIYLDPARRGARQEKVFLLADCQPNAVALLPQMLARAPRVLLKTAPWLDLTAAVQELGCVSHIWVVGIGNECKEVLYLLERSAPDPSQIPITAATPGMTDFTFTRAEEQATHGDFVAAPQPYLYEPSAAVLKAGAFKSFAQRFQLQKLHPHTHLYTAKQRIPEVPGRAFRVRSVCKYDRKAVQAAIPEGKANIATRNFPDSAPQVRQKLGLADGGNVYLFAATLLAGEKMMLVCEKD